MSELSDEQIEALCEAATPGPWEQAGREIVTRWSNTWQPIATTRSDGLAGPRSIANAALAAAARSLVPSLLERARKAEAERDARGQPQVLTAPPSVAARVLGMERAIAALMGERDALAAKLRAIEALCDLSAPCHAVAGCDKHRLVTVADLRAALSADTTPEATEEHGERNPCGRCCWPAQCADGCEKATQ